jgi:hypothetical protein
MIALDTIHAIQVWVHVRRKGSETMDRTMYATHMAPVADAARPCAGFGIGFQWRNVTLIAGLAKSRNAATKRSARHLGMATT